MPEGNETAPIPPPSAEEGVNGDRFMAEDVVSQIVETWETKHQSSPNPFLLILGGVQGSGKTTTLDILDQSLDFVTISPDEIRWKMFGEEYFLTQETGLIWRDTVTLARNMLLETALARGYSIAIDQNMNNERLHFLEGKADSSQYNIKSVLLNPPREVLMNRVRTRPRAIGKYNGNPAELEGTLQSIGAHDPSLYDLSIDTSTITPDQVASQIQELVTR